MKTYKFYIDLANMGILGSPGWDDGHLCQLSFESKPEEANYKHYQSVKDILLVIDTFLHLKAIDVEDVEFIVNNTPREWEDLQKWIY